MESQKNVGALDSSRFFVDGGDRDWFAVDRAGEIGFFTTFGSGLVPRLLLTMGDSDLKALGEYFSNLPSVTKAVLRSAALAQVNPAVPDPPTGLLARARQARSRSSDPLDSSKLGGWIDMARRGLFAFDAAARIASQVLTFSSRALKRHCTSKTCPRTFRNSFGTRPCPR